MPEQVDIKNPLLPPQDPSVFDSPVTQAIRFLAGLVGGYDPVGTLMGAVSPLSVVAPEARAVATMASKAKAPIKAFHGSPHDFDQFSMSKIGTGEGAQAYGHGLYFAENPATAKQYQKDLAGVDLLVNGAPVNQAPVSQSMRDVLSYMAERGIEPNNPRAIQTANDAYRAVGGDPAKWREFTQEWNNVIGTVETGSPRGKMYEVNIHADPEAFLDWDAPLSQQPKAAQEMVRERYPQHFEGAQKASQLEVEIKALSDQYGRPGDSYRAAIERAPVDVQKRWKSLVSEHASLSTASPGEYVPTTGESIYRNLGEDRDVSATLQQRGIPGIKYLDQGSRTAGEGTRNYVVFDDKLVEVVRKYMLAGLTLEEATRRAVGEQEQEQGIK